MILAIKFFGDGGVPGSKISAEIDNARAGCEQRLGKFGSQSVGQRKKNNLGFARKLFWIGIDKLERLRLFVLGEAWINIGKLFAGKLARSDRHKIDMWMREQQAHQLFAGVTGSAHHCDLCVLRCHNAQCVFRLSLIAIRLFACQRFR